MLTILLALVVGLGSFVLYMSAFFYPEVYRKGDLIWSGVGLFYALVLWLCADRITGGVLLGQIASVSLIGWFGWQTLTGRLGHTPTPGELQEKFTEALKPENRSQLIAQAKQQFAGVREQVQTLIDKTITPAEPEASTEQSYQPLTREDFGNPPVTVDSTPKPAAPKTDVKGAVANAGKAFSGLFKKPEKNTSTYVRKTFREQEKTAEENNTIELANDAIASEKAVEAKTVPTDQDRASESTIPSDDTIQEEMAHEAPNSEPTPTPEAAEADKTEVKAASAEDDSDANWVDS